MGKLKIFFCACVFVYVCIYVCVPYRYLFRARSSSSPSVPFSLLVSLSLCLSLCPSLSLSVCTWLCVFVVVWCTLRWLQCMACMHAWALPSSPLLFPPSHLTHAYLLAWLPLCLRRCCFVLYSAFEKPRLQSSNCLSASTAHDSPVCVCVCVRAFASLSPSIYKQTKNKKEGRRRTAMSIQ